MRILITCPTPPRLRSARQSASGATDEIVGETEWAADRRAPALLGSLTLVVRWLPPSPRHSPLVSDGKRHCRTCLSGEQTGLWSAGAAGGRGRSEGYRLYLNLTSCGLYRSEGSKGSPVKGLRRSDFRNCCRRRRRSKRLSPSTDVLSVTVAGLSPRLKILTFDLPAMLHGCAKHGVHALFVKIYARRPVVFFASKRERRQLRSGQAGQSPDQCVDAIG